MEPYQTLEEKIEACISALLRKEFPYTHTPDINEAAALGAVQAANDIVARDTTYQGASSGKRTCLDSYPAAQPAITRVSRQLREDTLPMFYDVNNLAIKAIGTNAADIRDGSSQVCRWLRCIGAENAHMIKSFTVCWYDGRPFSTTSAATINQMIAVSELAILAPVVKVKGARDSEEFAGFLS
ncbi:hypothetical protein LTR27_009141 [Elasticomyces elasticus]|nr:hypothetical protein LTR27_009141 [Elasticomyces elasticus]